MRIFVDGIEYDFSVCIDLGNRNDEIEININETKQDNLCFTVSLYDVDSLEDLIIEYIRESKRGN